MVDDSVYVLVDTFGSTIEDFIKSYNALEYKHMWFPMLTVDAVKNGIELMLKEENCTAAQLGFWAMVLSWVENQNNKKR